MADVIYLSSASYYDCPDGEGACGTCDKGSSQTAWPYVVGFPGNYAEQCFYDMLRLPCGYWFIVENICNPLHSHWMGVQVADHGPNPRLVCGIDRPTCNPVPSNRILDLTRQTYLWLGGNLTQGLMLTRVYVYRP